MKIYSDGKNRSISGKFPKAFRVLSNGVEVPFIRTGAETIRLSGNVPEGELDIEEVVREAKRPSIFKEQRLVMVGEEGIARLEQVSYDLEKKSQIIDEKANQIKALGDEVSSIEKGNAESIKQMGDAMAVIVDNLKKDIETNVKQASEIKRSVSQLALSRFQDVSDSLIAHEEANNPHRITKATIGLDKVENISPADLPVSKATQKALDKKADKVDFEDLKSKLDESSKTQEKIVKGLDRVNWVGGVGGLELPSGGKTGQVLTKASNKTGDYKWETNSASNVHNALVGRDDTDCHPISSITGLQNALDGKQPAGNYANTSLSNLTQAGKNVGNWSSNVSNCIVEIPQDIKLEYSGNTLTVKSGTKFYFPNGSSGTPQYEVSSDVSTTVSGTGQRVVFLYKYNTPLDGYNGILISPLDTVVSGSTDSQAGNPYHSWFDTTNNYINRYASDGTTRGSYLTLPLAIITVANNVITSIDQLFNGFGYVGHHIFRLPNVCVAWADGFNSDGTLKSTIKKFTDLRIAETSATTHTVIANSGNQLYIRGNYYEVDKLSDVTPVAWNDYYSKSDNKIYILAGSQGVIQETGCPVVSFDSNGTTITRFEVRPVIRLASQEDIEKSRTDYYGTCDTAAATQQKDVVCDGFELQTGVSIRVKFTNNQNYNGNPLLNVNGTGAISIKRYGTTNAGRYEWDSGEVVDFTYDGTNWIINNGAIATTSVYGKVQLSTSATTTWANNVASSAGTINSLVQNMIEPYAVYSSSSTYKVGDRVRYNYNAWECNTAITTAESWNSAHWTALPAIQDQLDITNNRVSNVITEIPQDVKMEINSNGRLVVKAGTKYYTPDGSVYMLPSDQGRVISSQKAFVVLLLNKSDYSFNQLFEIDYGKTCSGTTDALSGTPRHLWYDTTNNVIKFIGNSGTTDSYYAAFPLGLASGNGSVAQSIDKVFNGVGYIGHHIFVLPGIRSLAPNGKNADGTLNVVNNTKANLTIVEMTTLNKLLYTSTSTTSGVRGYEEYDEQSDVSNPQSYRLYYFRKPNISCYYSSGAFVESQRTPLVFFNYNGTSVTQFEIRPVYRAVTEEMLDNYLTTITGYDSTVAQTLKHAANGEIKWVND